MCPLVLNPGCYLVQFLFDSVVLFIYIWLHWLIDAAQAFTSVVSRGCSSSRCTGSALQWPLLWSASVVLHSTRVLPRPGVIPVSPVLAGGFLTSRPPGLLSYLGQLPYLLLKFKLSSDNVLVLTIVVTVNLNYCH